MNARVHASLVVTVLVLAGTACAELEQREDVRISVVGPDEVEVGETAFFRAETANGIVERYRWRSSDDAVATVDRGGQVTGRRAGEVTILAIGMVTEQTGSREITVVARDAPAVLDASIERDSGRGEASIDAAPPLDADRADTGANDGSDGALLDGAVDAAANDAAPAPTFVGAVHPILLARCGGCHAPGGPAAGTGFVLVDDPETDHEMLLDLVNTADPEASRLLVKARGEGGHGGGIVLLVNSAEYATLRNWIAEGAPP